ncbi:hypothetical protein PENTCL1PPCAC_21164, partial [Pristionchus entomophagus]
RATTSRRNNLNGARADLAVTHASTSAAAHRARHGVSAEDPPMFWHANGALKAGSRPLSELSHPQAYQIATRQLGLGLGTGYITPDGIKQLIHQAITSDRSKRRLCVLVEGFTMTVNPNTVEVEATGDLFAITLRNPEAVALLFSVNGATSGLYSITPTCGVVRAGSTARISVVRATGGTHKRTI